MITSVIIDSREPDSVKRLNFYGAQKAISLLPYGDIWATCEDGATLAIERKTPEDFIGSMISDRLIAQVRGLAEYREKNGWWCYVMITGELSIAPGGFTYAGDRSTKIAWQSVQGEILNIQEMGVFVTFAKDESDLEQAIVRLSNRNRQPTHKVPPPRRKGKRIAPASAFLSGLPGIGIDMADKIVDYCGTPARAIEMIVNGESIPGVGKVTREKTIETLGLKSNQTIGVIDNEYE